MKSLAKDGQSPRLSVHPLFFLGLLFSAATGRLWFTLALALSAVLHEYGHAAVAAKRGYGLSRISLMPYGAVIGGNHGEMSAADEIAVAVAGPLVNLFFCGGTLALFWLVPDWYPYTETVFTVNFSLLFSNLLPVYPLDGGRVLYAVLRRKLSPRRAVVCTEIVGIFVTAGLAVAFLALSVRNFTAVLFFAAVLPSLFSVGRAEGYRKLCFSDRAARIRSGVRLTGLAFSSETTLSAALKKMRAGECYRLYIFEGERLLFELSDAEFYRLAESRSLYERFADVLSGIEEKK